MAPKLLSTMLAMGLVVAGSLMAGCDTEDGRPSMEDWLAEMELHSSALREQTSAGETLDAELVDEMVGALYAIESCHKEGSLREAPYLSETLGQLEHARAANDQRAIAALLDDLDERIRLAQAELAQRSDDRACEQPPKGPAQRGKPVS